jgi:membrane protein
MIDKECCASMMTERKFSIFYNTVYKNCYTNKQITHISLAIWQPTCYLLGIASILPYCLSMQPINTSIFIAPFKQPSRYSIFKRIVNLVLAVVACIACINLWLISSEQTDNWHTKQANQLGVSLSTLSGNILISSLLKNDTKSLSQQLSYIADDPHVAAVSLFDNKGRILADNNAAASVVAAYKSDTISPLVFVKNITHNQQVIGYLSLILKEKEVMAYHSEYQNQLNQQVQMLMILAAIAGILLTRAFYKVRYRQLIRSSKQ